MRSTASAFLFPYLRLACGRRSENKKAGYFVPGFFFVAETDEISNLDLLEDIFKILEIIGSVNSDY